MGNSPITKVIDHLRRAVLASGEVGLTDGQLLECFVSHRDQAAVTALVRRHGPMVWDVCRRVLRNHHDVEDAFQATFLVLVRKAASIVPREMVGNWLYGVAHRTALKAGATMGRRQAREKQVKEMPEPEVVAEPDLWADLEPLLDQELSRLPDKYRVAIVFCDLEGKSRKEAARQLRIPEGTLSSRLTTARTILAKRLARHGLSVSGAALALILTKTVASAGVPSLVMSSTIQATSVYAAGQATTAGLISAKAAALTEGVLKAMLLSKLKTAGMLVLLFAFIAGVSTYGTLASEPKGGSSPKSAAENQGNLNEPSSGEPKKAPTGRPQEEQIAWGPAAQLGIVLKPNKKVFQPGEVVQVQLILRNAGQQKLSLAKPRSEVFEKFGMDIVLQDQDGRNLPWEWGGRHSSGLLTVSGAIGYSLNPGESCSLGEAPILIGSNKKPEDVLANLKVTPGQICRLKIKLKTYSLDRDDHAEPLESGTVEFRVDGAKVPGEGGR